MTKSKFMKILNQLKKCSPISDYHIELYYEGNNVGCIYGKGNLYEIEVEERHGYLLVYTDTFGILVDDAELRSI